MRINRSIVFDAGIAVGLLIVVVVSAVAGSDLFKGANAHRSRDVIFWMLQAGAILPLTLRREYPNLVVAMTGASLTALSVVNYPPSLSAIGVLIAMYSVAAYASRVDALISLGIGAVAIAVSVTSQLSGAESAVGVLSNYVFFGTAWLLGDSIRSHRERVADLERAAARTARDRLDADERAARAERNRIARELHDIVAHSLSVMVIHAGAVRRDLEQSADERHHRVRTIEDTGRATLNEMRQLLGRLRSDSDETGSLSPQPGIDDLTDLVAEFSDAGLGINFVIEREAGVDLSQTAAMSTYRIVQESLTNCLRHAGDANVEAVVHIAADGVDIAVADDGRGAAADPTDPGYGLIGMRERVALFGGTVQAGPRIGGGWSVRASLPHAKAASR
ncbi:MAG: sensor histidine kinase [Actinobacteria bacterium]|nr:sensor histidine kinase [Actinomycetota bacterium]